MGVTVLHDTGVLETERARRQDGGLWLDPEDFAAATGWTPKPEGLCRGEACLPQPPGSSWTDDEGRVDVVAYADRLGIPVVHDDEHGVWALGESATAAGSEPTSVQAPDFALPDLDGRTRRLSDFRGKKVLLLAWASY